MSFESSPKSETRWPLKWARTQISPLTPPTSGSPEKAQVSSWVRTLLPSTPHPPAGGQGSPPLRCLHLRDLLSLSPISQRDQILFYFSKHPPLCPETWGLSDDSDNKKTS